MRNYPFPFTMGTAVRSVPTVALRTGDRVLCYADVAEAGRGRYRARVSVYTKRTPEHVWVRVAQIVKVQNSRALLIYADGTKTTATAAALWVYLPRTGRKARDAT